jgi:hypothetical protein
MRKIGLIVGREWSFPPAFLEAVQRRNAGVAAEYARLGGTRMNEPCDYTVLIDRISHEVPYYRSYLKNAVLQGVHVVNDPFMWTADDKFFEASLADRLGVAHPRTVVLPNREYVPGIVHTESLRNLIYPLDWGAIVEHVGLPCVLKDAHGGGWKNVSVCHSLDELLFHYNQSGLLTMIVQEFIQWECYVRCLVLGQDEVLVMRYDPVPRKYLADAGPLEPKLETRIVGDCLKLCRALGYEMNTLEWAVRGGVPYAIDFMNPAPDMDVNSLTPMYFQWAVEHMADLAIRLALNPKPQAKEYRWGKGF